MLGSWRLAARLARRETRRRPGRAMLVVLLIAVPVFALTVADVLVETQFVRRGSESFRRSYGPASVVFDVDGVADPRFESALPVGSTVVRFASAWELPLTPANGQGLRSVKVLNLGAADSAAFAGLELTSGRNARAGELVMSRGVAQWLGVHVGELVRFSRPGFSGRVVGIARSLEDYRTPILIAPSFDFGVVRQPGLVRTTVAVELPRGVFVTREFDSTFERLTLHAPGETRPFPKLLGGEALPDSPGLLGATIPAQFGNGSTVPAQGRFWGWVAVALLLAAIGVIISAAFATTAVRQLVTLGLVSANGGDQRFLRTMLTLQGTVLGAIGAALGVTAGLVGLSLAQNWIESLYHHELNYVVNPYLGLIALTAIGAATIAARFPARTTSRVPVLAALGGRRPLAPVPPLRWLKATIIFGTGLGLLALVAAVSRDRTSQPQTVALVAIAGGLLVMAGAAYLAPVVVELLVKCCARLGPAARIAARSLVRVRSRSAAVVTAGAIAGALAIAVVTAMLGLGTGRNVERYSALPANVMTITSTRVVDGLSLPLPGELSESQRVVEGVLPGVKFGNIEGFLAAPVGTADVGPPSFPVLVDSPPLRRLLVLSGAAKRALDRDGAVWDAGAFALAPIANGSRSGEPQVVTLQVGGDGPRFIAQAAPIGWRQYFGSEAFVVVTPARVRSLGVRPLVVGVVGVTSKPIAEGQRDALYRGQYQSDPYVTPPAVDTNPSGVSVSVGSGDTIPAFWRGVLNPASLQLWIAGLASLFVLLVVGIGLLLGAAEGAEERTVLDSLGAKPKSRRRMSATNAYLLATGGAVLALPTGFVPIAVVFQALQKPIAGQQVVAGSSLYPLVEFPWIAAIAIVVVIPIVAAFLAWAGSAAAQRTRPILGHAGFGTD